MFHKVSTILIWSEDFRKLSDWYLRTFQLKVVEELDHPQDTGVLMEFPDGGPWIWVGQHSEIHGKSRDPLRVMFNITVDSVEETYAYLVKNGAPVIAKPFKAPTFDKWFATFSDPDGNTIQIIGPK
jgi:predicted enzyme related to lactoylglutathione lyase